MKSTFERNQRPLATNGLPCTHCGGGQQQVVSGRDDLARMCFDCQLVKIEGEIGAAAKRGKVSRLSPYFIPGRMEFAARVREINRGGKHG